MRLFSLILLVACAPKAPPEPAAAPLPEADALFAAYNTSVGCDGDFSGVTRWTSKGQLQLPAMGIAGTQEVYKDGASMLVVADLPGIGRTEQGYDGTWGWSVDPMQGPRLLKDKELEPLVKQAELCSEDGEEYQELAVTGAEDFHGQQTWRVQGKTAEGEPVVFWFAESGGLLVGAQRTQRSAMGKMKATMRFEDYREFDGLKMASRVVTKVMGTEMVATVDELSLQPEEMVTIEAPPLVQELIAERTAE